MTRGGLLSADAPIDQVLEVGQYFEDGAVHVVGETPDWPPMTRHWVPGWPALIERYLHLDYWLEVFLRFDTSDGRRERRRRYRTEPANRVDRTLRTYADHYNRQRPHRALGLTSPLAGVSISVPITGPVNPGDVRRRDLLGGLIHEYHGLVA